LRSCILPAGAVYYLISSNVDCNLPRFDVKLPEQGAQREVKMYDLTLKNCRIITPAVQIENGSVSIKDGKIASIEKIGIDPVSAKDMKSIEVLDLKNNRLLPGFFDIHTHGGAGFEYDDIKDEEKGLEVIEKVAMLSASEGVTSFLPTMCASMRENFKEFIERVRVVSNILSGARKGARPVGINLELFMYPGLGAFASEKGAKDAIPKPNIETWKKIEEAAGGSVKIVTIAPEWDDALNLIRHLRFKGIIPSIGHTQASDTILDEAIRRGANLVTHILNTTFQPEQDQAGVIVPGVNEYLLTRDDIMAEIIVDSGGFHVHPNMLKIAIKCLGVDNLITISDSLQSRGTDLKEFERDGVTLSCDGEVNRKPNGHLAGSAFGMDRAVRNFFRQSGVSVKDAVKTATVNPARLFNIYEKGSIEIGKDADLTLIDENFRVLLTVVQGKVVYSTPF
jgi:N-acetylglucosamine-6-phosphate deacetylase